MILQLVLLALVDLRMLTSCLVREKHWRLENCASRLDLCRTASSPEVSQDDVLDRFRGGCAVAFRSSLGCRLGYESERVERAVSSGMPIRATVLLSARSPRMRRGNVVRGGRYLEEMPVEWTASRIDHAMKVEGRVLSMISHIMTKQRCGLQSSS